MPTARTIITVSCDDVKELGAENSSVITVEYTAKLNDGAEIGKPGNPNKVYLEYSNDPNHEGEGSPTGKTPEDEVIVFTYELDVTKVDGATEGEDAGKTLKDAEFVLYRVVDDKTEYVQVDSNGKVTGWTKDKVNASTLISDTNGLFKVIGLDAGTYYLEETKAPTGYNMLEEPITIVITATIIETEDEQKLETLTIKVDNGEEKNGDLETGIVDTTVLNNKGATLPSTGGMGTTMFYIIGGILVAGAVVLLVTRKRMSAE